MTFAQCLRTAVTFAQCLREEFDIAEHGNAARRSGAHLRRRQGHARTDGDEIDTGKRCVAVGAEDQFRLRHFLAQAGQPGRVVAAIRHAHTGTAAIEEARHRQAGFAQPQDQSTFSCGIHLSFNVDSPNKTSIIVMIQKRTTTCDSFQPDSS